MDELLTCPPLYISYIPSNHTHIHTSIHVQSDQANTNIPILIPLTLVEQFPKGFMDGLIMQQQEEKQTQHIQQIHDKCTADIPSMLVLNKIILNLTEIKNKYTNKKKSN